MTSAEVLPPIGPAAVNAVLPRSGAPMFDPYSGAVADILVQGNQMRGNLSSAIVSASMSYSATQINQMSITFQDTDDGVILGSGILNRGTTVDWRDQHLVVAGLDIRRGEGGPRITVKARSRVVSILSGPGHIGKGSWGEQNTGHWIIDRAREAGAPARTRSDLGTQLLTRTADNDTTWAMMQRAAAVAGAWCFEIDNTVVFMKPSQLTESWGRWWNIAYVSTTDYNIGLDGQPEYSWSDSGSESLSFNLIAADADKARPGDGVTLSGNLGPAGGDWIMTQVDPPLSDTAGTRVSCVRIVDPAPTANGIGSG